MFLQMLLCRRRFWSQREDTTMICPKSWKRVRHEFVKLSFVKKITVPRHEAFIDQARWRLAEGVVVWKESSRGNANSQNKDVEVAKVDSVIIIIERNLILERFEKDARALHNPVIANVEQKVTLSGTRAKIRELLEGGRLIDRSDYSVNISIIVRKVQRILGHVKSKDLEVQKMPGLADEDRRSQKELSMLK